MKIQECIIASLKDLYPFSRSCLLVFLIPAFLRADSPERSRFASCNTQVCPKVPTKGWFVVVLLGPRRRRWMSLMGFFPYVHPAIVELGKFPHEMYSLQRKSTISMVRVLSQKTSTRKNLQLHFDNLPHDIAQVASEHDIYVFVSCFYNEVPNLVSTCFPKIQIQHFFLSGAIWISTISFSEFIAEYDSCILLPPKNFHPSIPTVSPTKKTVDLARPWHWILIRYLHGYNPMMPFRFLGSIVGPS